MASCDLGTESTLQACLCKVGGLEVNCVEGAVVADIVTFRTGVAFGVVSAEIGGGGVCERTGDKDGTIGGVDVREGDVTYKTDNETRSITTTTSLTDSLSLQNHPNTPLAPVLAAEVAGILDLFLCLGVV